MNEQMPSNRETLALDRAVLDKALAAGDRTTFLKRLDKNSWRQTFSLRILVDRRSGRVLDATVDAGRHLEPSVNEIVITADAELASRADPNGKVIEESLTLKETAVPHPRELSEQVLKHIQDLLYAWRESHTVYIAHL